MEKEKQPMLTPYSGGCACDAIRYTGTAEPSFAWNCHCRDCQHASGGGQCPVVYVPKIAVSMTGQVTYTLSRLRAATLLNGDFVQNVALQFVFGLNLSPSSLACGLAAGMIRTSSRPKSMFGQQAHRDGTVGIQACLHVSTRQRRSKYRNC